MTAWRLTSLAACVILGSSGAVPAYAGKADNSIRFAHEQVLNHADPYFSATYIAGILAENVWDTLVYRDPRSGAYQGGLAVAWRSIDDRTLEIDLRQGVVFHDGSPFGADDVVYTLNFVSRPENNAFNLNLVRWIDHVEKTGPYQVRLVAKAAAPAALAFLASPFIVIHPHDYYARVGPTGVNKQPVGTGPFRVVEHALGQYVVLERNARYFSGGPKPQPQVQRVEIRFIPDAQTRVAEVVAGGLDLIVNVGRDQAEQLRLEPGLAIRSAPTERYAFLQMNTLPRTRAPALRDVRVRRAIMHAIDREAMARFLVGDGARVLHAECHPDQFGCDDTGVPRYRYDPGEARRLLAEAGYADGFDVELYAWRDRNQVEAIVGYLSAVGMRAKMRFVQQAAMSAARRSGRAPLAVSEMGSFGVMDVANSTSYFHTLSPIDANRDAELNDILQRADNATAEPERRALYAEGLRQIAEKAYVLPLYTIVDYQVASADLMIGPFVGEGVRFYEMAYR